MTKNLAISAVQDAYGMTKKEAIQFIKNMPHELVMVIVDGFTQNAKKTFFED